MKVYQVPTLQHVGSASRLIQAKTVHLDDGSGTGFTMPKLPTPELETED